ncbi:MAG TPA: hypothetical protein VMH86_17670 [Rhizomicrobium sp.]|nr:hypothetical protein [Rhizomicrobium sp.]
MYRGADRIWLHYSLGGVARAEPFASRLAAIGRAAALAHLPAASRFAIFSDGGACLLAEPELLAVCRTYADGTLH